MFFSLFLFCLCLIYIDCLTIDDFCDCSGTEKCDCDYKSYMKALEDDFAKREKDRLSEWESEKEEWLQEIQLEKEVWTSELEAKEQLLEQRAAKAGVSTEAAGDGPPSNVGRSDVNLDASADESPLERRKRLAAELRSELTYLQFPEADRCIVTPQLHFNFRQMGLGAAWHGITLALTSGYVTRRAVVIDPQPVRWVWGDKQNCGDRTLSCWFEPLSNCKAIINGPHSKIDYSQRDTEFKKDNTEFDWWAAAKRQHQPELSVYLKGSVWGRGNDFVPTKYRALGLLWWRSQLLAFVLRPTANTQAAIDETRSQLELANVPYIGMHVRRGAKWHESPFVSLETYVAAARRHVERAEANGDPVPKTIFLATDSADVVEELTTTYADEFKWVYREDTYRHTAKNVSWHDETRRRWKAASVDAVDVVRDVWMLAEAQYLVCTFSSNIGRVVTELRYAWSHVPPGSEVYSVDKDNKWLVDP